jgi:hypothetical protein
LKGAALRVRKYSLAERPALMLPSLRITSIRSAAEVSRVIEDGIAEKVIGERVRDKIAASTRKGIWVGSSVPLGYRSVAWDATIPSASNRTVNLAGPRAN